MRGLGSINHPRNSESAYVKSQSLRKLHAGSEFFRDFGSCAIRRARERKYGFLRTSVVAESVALHKVDRRKPLVQRAYSIDRNGIAVCPLRTVARVLCT